MIEKGVPFLGDGETEKKFTWHFQAVVDFDALKKTVERMEKDYHTKGELIMFFGTYDENGKKRLAWSWTPPIEKEEEVKE